MVYQQIPKRGTVWELWQRLDRWLEKHVPSAAAALAPPADWGRIRKFEEAIGMKLPSSVCESFAVHDGQVGRSAGAIFGLELLPLDVALRRWSGWRKCERLNDDFRDKMESFPPHAVQLAYTDSGWIPLTSDYGGNHLGVDLDPAPMGQWGQVITFGRDEFSKYVVSPSWQDFLQFVVDQLEHDNFVLGRDDYRLRDPENSHFHDAVAALYRGRKGEARALIDELR